MCPIVEAYLDDGGSVLDEAHEWSPTDRIRASYDTVAERYAAELGDEMFSRPFERSMLLAFSELVRSTGLGVVGDVGCGPGHVSKYLASLGVRTLGIDISEEMIAQARLKFPEGEFRVASMFDLPVPTSGWSGAVVRYATLHCNADERARAFHELRRVIRHGGYISHSFYESAPAQPVGSVYHLQSWFGFHVDLHTYFVSVDDAAAELESSGFEIVAALVREPVPAQEVPARRCTIVGRRR